MSVLYETVLSRFAVTVARYSSSLAAWHTPAPRGADYVRRRIEILETSAGSGWIIKCTVRGIYGSPRSPVRYPSTVLQCRTSTRTKSSTVPVQSTRVLVLRIEYEYNSPYRARPGGEHQVMMSADDVMGKPRRRSTNPRAQSTAS